MDLCRGVLEKHMFYRWRTRCQKAWFRIVTAGIWDTPPMPVVDAPWNIVTLSYKCDPCVIQMYLLAIKSFYSRLKRGRITLIVERDFSPAVRRKLEHHLPGIGFANFEDIDLGACQSGGCWDTLMFALERSREEYVIQLDSDTLTFGPDIGEVIHCAENNIPFTLSSWGDPIVPMLAAVKSARERKSDYVGIAAERLFDRYPGAEHLKYVRASGGFTGFARGGFARDEIENFHREGEKMLGARWREWGTEQCASNFAIANSPGSLVLPFPKYANFPQGTVHDEGTFLHFFGTHRFKLGYYARLARGVIAELRGGK
jgi:hypothetical protein